MGGTQEARFHNRERPSWYPRVLDCFVSGLDKPGLNDPLVTVKWSVVFGGATGLGADGFVAVSRLTPGLCALDRAPKTRATTLISLGHVDASRRIAEGYGSSRKGVGDTYEHQQHPGQASDNLHSRGERAGSVVRGERLSQSGAK